ncbi:type I phosphodiesterase / nucleotide pyrophosphatase [Anopheles sinensis]|uniref:Type I phosphodiesterase / nucleotide pyrophosphatase n=1 Tax=Anopheles sinensis TaxID=74873 RepID=A0A084WTN3_ANOSI|nr:type I phosphodiesterase / nucleotide pyrophosphatase [Anopheles sinensis]
MRKITYREWRVRVCMFAWGWRESTLGLWAPHLARIREAFHPNEAGGVSVEAPFRRTQGDRAGERPNLALWIKANLFHQGRTGALPSLTDHVSAVATSKVPEKRRTQLNCLRNCTIVRFGCSSSCWQKLVL